MLQPTRHQYGELDTAYDHFNTTLFSGELPRCLITLQRKSKAAGFFHGNRFVTWDGVEVTDEIALNPTLFRHLTVEDTLSTLVHEQAHLWQHHFGQPSRSGYHNREWANKMDSLGLMASDTGEPGGKRTGQRVTHWIQPDGPFARSCADLLETGFVLPYVQRTDDIKASKKAESKTKFTCRKCGSNAWGRPELEIICGVDKVVMTPSDPQITL
jgi:predicted SprT family Zn-dependent metalloprotease